MNAAKQAPRADTVLPDGIVYFMVPKPVRKQWTRSDQCDHVSEVCIMCASPAESQALGI